MLPNVWSVDEFKKQSSKIFSTGRSAQLQAIDLALGRAHMFYPTTEQAISAMIDLIEAIVAWRQAKAGQGRRSGRALAVESLYKQLAATSEQLYRRKVSALDIQERKAELEQSKLLVQQTFKQLMQKPPTPVKPPPMMPQVPPPPIPGKPPTRSPSEDRLFSHLAQAMLDQRRKAMGFDEADLFEDCDARQKGRLAARCMLCVPDAVTDVNAARAEALRVIAAMLGNDVSVIKRLLESNLEVVVVSRDQGMTALQQFKELSGQNTFDGRSWDTVRGVGNVKNKSVQAMISERKELRKIKESGKGAGALVAIDPIKGRVYTAVTEENLLGGLTTAPGGGCYATGYSTTTHEFAHSVHQYGLSEVDRAAIERAYKMRLAQGEHEQWVDGPRVVNGKTCYAAQTVYEYFAQLSNAWLGVNMGSDPYTNRPRNNGRQWVLDHEPRFVADVFERVYGKMALEDLNPTVILKN